jgi:uncharacterized protein with ParB-like and HNH nuclease domain
MKPYSIKEILSKDNYIIPIYQRNYAWGQQEITQLIKDIVEFFNMDNYEKEKSYYLGSLVCFRRDNGFFELIDGQQRHTTIALINLVLKKLGVSDVVPHLNLKFDSRKNSAQKFLEALYRDFDNLHYANIERVENIKSAVDIIQDELKGKNVELFAQYFYNDVKLFRVEVPHETDLNHYFEIMNNRGEQLEKPEIVKALLMGKIDKSEDKDKFAKIWDACSDMSSYVYYSEFKSLFNEKGNIKINEIKFDSIEIKKDNDDEEQSLNEILSNHAIPNDFPKEEISIKAKYKSTIDFSNFLLLTLKLKYNEVALNDKKLLEQFQKYLSVLNFSIEFIENLFKFRLLFDKYIIKQDLSDADDNKQNWGIRKPKSEFNGTKNTFENEDDEELVKLQIILHYSYQTNKDWLYCVMRDKLFLLDDKENLKEYTDSIFNLAKDKFDSNNLSYPDISIFNLYFIDFLLWKLYVKEVRNKEKNQLQEPLLELKNKICSKKDLFNTFKFRQLNSKEHLFPQANADKYQIDFKYLNDIGNLCLISASQNSQGNKDIPSEKKNSYKNDNSSLKRLIMFESFENDKYEIKQMEEHKESIKKLIEWGGIKY